MPVPFARSASQTRPTFSRDFAGLKTLDHGAGPAITFTRASNATYFDANGVLQTASNNQPRFDHDPSSRGLLIEESRTNLYQRSAEFDNAYWNKTRASITANAIAAPDGTTSADLLVEDNTASNSHFAFRQVAHATANGAVTVSVFAKAKERDRLSISVLSGITTPTIDLSGGTVVFNLAAGTAGSFSGSSVGTATNGTGSAFITNVGGGWYRCSITLTPNGVTATDTQAYFGLHNGTSSSYTGDNTSGLYIWGAQLEAGAFPTSYIPTTSAAATRSADSAVVTPISGFYNQSEGTLFAEYSPVSLPLSGDFPRIVQVGNTTSSANMFTLGYYNDSSSLGHFGNYFVATVEQLNKARTTGLLGQTSKAAVAVTTNNGHYAANGSLVGSEDTSLSMGSASDFTHFLIGRTSGGVSARTAVHIRKIAYYPRRLSNTLLQQLTT